MTSSEPSQKRETEEDEKTGISCILGFDPTQVRCNSGLSPLVLGFSHRRKPILFLAILSQIVRLSNGKFIGNVSGIGSD